MSIFQEVREGVTIAQSISYLGLKAVETKGDQLRFDCPKCGGSRTLSVNLQKGFRCFQSDKKGDDATALVSHVKGIRNGEAAELLKAHFLSSSTEAKGKPSAKGRSDVGTVVDVTPLELLGIDAPLAKHLNIREQEGRIWFEMRDAQGVMHGSLAIATREDVPLVAFVAETEETVKADAPSSLQDLWRIVKGGR